MHPNFSSDQDHLKKYVALLSPNIPPRGLGKKRDEEEKMKESKQEQSYKSLGKMEVRDEAKTKRKALAQSSKPPKVQKLEPPANPGGACASH